MPVTVVIADDHQLLRQGLRRYLDAGHDLEVVAEASNGREAVTAAAAHRPDVAIVDIRMDGVDGIEATRRIARRSPETAVVILTGHEERRLVLEAMRAGARGYVLKTRDLEHLARTIRMVARGNMVIDPDAASTVADGLHAGRDAARADGGLTTREIEVLTLAAGGHTNREIGGRLFISADTVKTHLDHVYQKLGAPDRTAAVAEALRRQLID